MARRSIPLALMALAAGAVVQGNAHATSDNYKILTTAWPGSHGGVPPVDIATPESMEAAYRQAVNDKRAAVQAITTNPAPPTFENTIVALESSGKALDRIAALLQIFTSTASDDTIAEVSARIAPLQPRLEDEIAHDDALFARVRAVYDGLPASAPDDAGRRLTTVIHDDLISRGAALDDVAQQRLSESNARLAELRGQFGQNVAREEATLVVFIEQEDRLDGLGTAERDAAKAAATARDRPDAWAIPIARPSVWPVLTKAKDRALREQVWKAWVGRGANAGPNDNRPIMAEILKLRGQQAKLLGFDTFADFQTASRMVGTPEVAMGMLKRTWDLLLQPTRDEIVALQALAKSESADFTLQPWDRLFYAERLRQQKFSIDSDAIRAYLSLDNVVDAMFWAAGETYGFTFRTLPDIPVVSPDIRVVEVSRDGDVVGLLWVDLFQRTGKRPASWATQYRSASHYDGKVLPLVALHSSAQHPAKGGPVLVEWERANVIFHEFGHALHMLSNGTAYPSLGSLKAPWDFIEVPSLLNERWLLDRTVLSRFARHHKTGEPMPDDMIDRIDRVIKHDRVFSVTLHFLGTAIVDMTLHQMADGRDIDAMAVEKQVLEELELPQAIDLTLYASHAYHTFSAEYAASVYTYLWSDVMAADIAEVFLAAPGGLYDQDVAKRYRALILDAGNSRPMAEAFREFRGRDPSPDALLRRFDLIPATVPALH